MNLSGKIREGKGDAQKFLSMKPYKLKIKEKTGFEPFPGTLNLEVKPEKLEKLKENKEKKVIESFEYEGQDYGGLKLYEIQIENLEAYLLDIDRADHGEEIAEIIESEKLRDKLGLENGDRVEISG